MKKEKIIKAHPKADISTWEMYIYSIFMGLALKTLKVTNFVWLGVDIANWLIGIGITMFTLDAIQKDKPYRKLFENTNLIINEQTLTLIRKRKANYGYDLIFSLPPGISSKQIEAKRTELEEYLNGDIKISVRKRKLIIQVFTGKLKSYYKYKFVDTKSICEFPIGYTHENKVLMIDLEKVTHVLIAGETNSGKSTLLRVIITNLILSRKRISLHLIDLKNGTEFNVFRKCKMVKTFARDPEAAEKVLMNLINEVDRRYNLFYEYDVVDIREYNNIKGIRKLDYQIVIIDEFADLQKRKNHIAMLETLAAKARACGIHLILSTQRPDSQVLSGRIKANIPCIIGLKTMNSTNSRIIIDENGLEDLRGKGHGLLKYGDITEFQAMYLSPQQARDLVKHTYVKEKKKEKKLENATEVKRIEKVGEVEDFNFLKMLVGGRK